MDLRAELAAHARFTGRIRQESGVQEGDERLGNTLGGAVGEAGVDRAEDSAGFDRRVGPGDPIAGPGVNLLDQHARQCDARGDALVVFHPDDDSPKDATQVEGEAIGRLGGPKAGQAGLEALADFAQAGRERFRDQSLV